MRHAAADRRFLSLWFPHLPTDRLRRAPHLAARSPDSRPPARPAAMAADHLPMVVVDSGHAATRIVAVDRLAEQAGLVPGLSLADARARHPALDARRVDRAADARLLARVARWANRYTPHVAPDGEDGLLLDITGSAHLFGGESALRRDMRTRLAAMGMTARIGIAGTTLAAWAAARFIADTACATPAARDAHAPDPTIVAAGRERQALDGLPPAALRLTAATLERLDRLGLRRIGDLHDLPRRGLAARFGDEVNARLDQLLGRRATPISPLAPAPLWRTQLAFAEPISTPEDIARVVAHLLDQLCAQLVQAELGARRLELECRRVDGRIEGCAIATAAPARDPARLATLFAERLATIDPGFGIETATMIASVVEPFVPAQFAFTQEARHAADSFGPPAAIDLAPFIDQIVNRLGPDAIAQVEIVPRHVPELAQRSRPATAMLGIGAPLPAQRSVASSPSRQAARDDPAEASSRAAAWRNPWNDAPTRPLRLLVDPEPVEVTASVPDGPPLLFRWRRRIHRVRHAEGPERIAPEWWLAFETRRRDGPRAAVRTRDYYRVEDEDGRRFWLFRDGLWNGDATRPRWYLHGLFA
ncbi:MAG: DNA polymerase Y family protein [Alphaproteobacteria bacterium]|nr:DNA polymerase Y family protein [Alphaproteobacteria bacterium]